MRDYFRRDFQKNKSAPTGSAAKKVKKYVYADLLYFLVPVFDKRNTEGNYELDDSHNNSSQESETQEEHSVEQIDDHTNTTSTTILQPPSPVSTLPASSLKRNKKDIPSQILSILHQNQQKANQKQQEVEDDDMKFLLSFRTHMKQMNENQKIDFKLGMLQLVKKINTEYNSSPSSSLSYDNFSHRSVTPVSSRGYSPSFSYDPVPETSPNMLYKTQSPLPTFISSSSSQNKTTNYQSAPNNSRVVINSIRHLPPLQPPRHHYTSPNLQHAEDTEAASFLVVQSQGQEQEDNIGKYLKFN